MRSCGASDARGRTSIAVGSIAGRSSPSPSGASPRRGTGTPRRRSSGRSEGRGRSIGGILRAPPRPAWTQAYARATSSCSPRAHVKLFTPLAPLLQLARGAHGPGPPPRGRAPLDDDLLLRRPFERLGASGGARGARHEWLRSQRSWKGRRRRTSGSPRPALFREPEPKIDGDPPVRTTWDAASSARLGRAIGDLVRRKRRSSSSIASTSARRRTSSTPTATGPSKGTRSSAAPRARAGRSSDPRGPARWLTSSASVSRLSFQRKTTTRAPSSCCCFPLYVQQHHHLRMGDPRPQILGPRTTNAKAFLDPRPQIDGPRTTNPGPQTTNTRDPGPQMCHRRRRGSETPDRKCKARQHTRRRQDAQEKGFCFSLGRWPLVVGGGR